MYYSCPPRYVVVGEVVPDAWEVVFSGSGKYAINFISEINAKYIKLTSESDKIESHTTYFHCGVWCFLCDGSFD